MHSKQTMQAHAKKYGLKFAVNSRFYDSGKVESWIETCTPNRGNFSEEHDEYDFYFDIFDTYEDAERFMTEALNA